MSKKYIAIASMIFSFILLFCTVYIMYLRPKHELKAPINIATFMVEDNIYKKSEILFGKVVDFPTAPEIDGKEFLYWTLNEKEYNNEEIKEDVIFYAKYTDIN